MDDHDQDPEDLGEIPPELMAQFQALMAQHQQQQAAQVEEEAEDFDEKVQNDFFDACRAGNLEVVKALFARGSPLLFFRFKKKKIGAY